MLAERDEKDEPCAKRICVESLEIEQEENQNADFSFCAVGNMVHFNLMRLIAKQHKLYRLFMQHIVWRIVMNTQTQKITCL